MKLIAIFFLLSGLLLAIWVYVDTSRRRQSMSIMRVVWILTMLWSSWIGLLAYLSFGRQKKEMNAMPSGSKMDMSSGGMNMSRKIPKWQGVALSTLHCGSGCVLADVIGESISGYMGFSLYVGWGVDYALALLIGVYFQYMAIRQMNNISPQSAISKAVKSDVLSLTAWQIGMYSFMAIYFAYFADSEFNRFSYDFWIIMQWSMVAGFIVSYPMNIVLIKIGLKHSM